MSACHSATVCPCMRRDVMLACSCHAWRPRMEVHVTSPQEQEGGGGGSDPTLSGGGGGVVMIAPA